MIVRVDSLTIQTQLHRRTSTTVAQLTGIRTANRTCHNRRALRRITAQSALTLFLRRHPWALYKGFKGFKGFKGCPAFPQHRMRRRANDRSANGTLPCPVDSLDADPPNPLDTSKTGNDPSPKRSGSWTPQYLKIWFIIVKS